MTAVEILNKHLIGKTSITQDTEGFVLAVVNAMEEYAALNSAPKLREVMEKEIVKKAEDLIVWAINASGPDSDLHLYPQGQEVIKQKALDFANGLRDLLKGGEQWISVEERLPEREQSVLVYSPRNEELFKIFDAVFDGEMFRELDANDYAETLYTEGSYVGVTHWMPMPEPPKTKGGEGK